MSKQYYLVPPDTMVALAHLAFVAQGKHLGRKARNQQVELYLKQFAQVVARIGGEAPRSEHAPSGESTPESTSPPPPTPESPKASPEQDKRSFP